jgi:putative phosphoesterase
MGRMRILLVSDIHGNRAALEAVREECDVCLFLGDLVDYGIEPKPCIDWARRRMTHGVRGNHDHGAAQGVAAQGAAGFRYLTAQTRPITRQQLDAADRRFLADLPVTRWLTLGGKRFLLVHGSPRDPLDDFAPPDTALWAERLRGVDADYVCVGHTHQQYTLRVNGTLVVNPGSVGLPRDGDPRAAYALITDVGVELRRVEYPIEEAIAAVEASPLPDQAKQMVTDIYRTGRPPGR